MKGKNQQHHVLVVGGGPGGYPAAIRAAQLGARVTLVDRDSLGGTCLHRGCIPTKFLLKSAKNYEVYTQFAGKYHDSVAPADAAILRQEKQKIVNRLTMGTESLLKKNNVEVIAGTASFLDNKTVLINETDRKITPTSIIIATGSKVVRPPIPGLDLPGVVDSDGLLELEAIPKRLAVIGGGYIGLEFAQIFKMLGAEVSVVEMLPRLVATADSEASQTMEKLFKGMGISIHTNSTVTEVVSESGALCLMVKQNNKTQEINADVVLVAVGRAPQLDLLNLENTGIRQDDGGAIIVNAKLETSVPNVYAIGDVVGGVMLAHKASAEGECAVENACGQARDMSYDVIPSVMYTFPEMAAVGLTEETAKERYGSVLVGRFPFAANGKAVLSGAHHGYVKVIADSQAGCIVGATIIGPEAGNLIGEAALAIKMESTLSEISDTIHAHPTLSEAIREACLDATGEAVHLPPN